MTAPSDLAASLCKLCTTRRSLAAALRPFVEAYRKAAEPIGDSDLYDEQPRSVSVTLGDCRRAAALLRSMP